METLLEPAVLEHRFEPVIFENTTKLIVGTVPPETAPFYFSNSPRTRLWDILKTINDNSESLCKGSYLLETEEKKQIIKSLNLGLCDIIKKYSRLIPDSGADKHVIPIEYFNLPEIIKDTKVDTLLFVYEIAAKWFLYSSQKFNPLVTLKVHTGEFYKFEVNGRMVKCILLPNPLNRGRAGETLESKLEEYKSAIL
jgi:G:T/U-mismatch repair DNA glycosylase